MVLLNEAADGATHRDDVVIGMRREHYHALLCRHGTFRAIGVVGVGFATRPSCDGVLQVVEYLDVAVVCRTETGKQVRESVLVIVLVGELEDWLVQKLAEPYDGGTDGLLVPLAVGDEPGVYDARELGGGSKVADKLGVVMCLNE